MDGAGANVFEVEIAPTPVAALDEVTRSKMVKVPKPKVAHKRTYVVWRR